MKIIHLLKSSLQSERPSKRNYHTFGFRFKGGQHDDVKNVSAFKKVFTNMIESTYNTWNGH